MNHTPHNVAGSPYRTTVTLTENSTMRDLYQLLETQDIPEHIALEMNGHSDCAYIDREEAREFFIPYTLFIDTQIKAQFLGRLKELPITPFIREERDLSHEKKTESDDIQTLIASSF